MTIQDIIKVVEGMRKKDHGYVSDGHDDAMRCDCDRCFDVYQYNEVLGEVVEKLRDISCEINR